MQKLIGSILLISGTCIGSGMIALPMVLAKLGIISSIIYTSVINLELNLQAGKGLTLGMLGKYFSGHTAQIIGTVSLKLLSYALLAVFIYGGSSILQKLLALSISITYIGAWYIIITSKVSRLYKSGAIYQITYNNCNFSYWTCFHDSVR